MESPPQNEWRVRVKSILSPRIQAQNDTNTGYKVSLPSFKEVGSTVVEPHYTHSTRVKVIRQWTDHVDDFKTSFLN